MENRKKNILENAIGIWFWIIVLFCGSETTPETTATQETWYWVLFVVNLIVFGIMIKAYNRMTEKEEENDDTTDGNRIQERVD